MPLSIVVFEHEIFPFDWAEEDLHALDRLRTQFGVEPLRATVAAGQRVLRAGQHVGVVRLRNATIQILPKVFKQEEGEVGVNQIRRATCNLLHMLSYSTQLRTPEHVLAALMRGDGDWFEILTRLFAIHLAEEWQRGAQRTYQRIAADVTALKGKWCIGEQLRRGERKHIFCVEYDEFTADNSLNRVFRFVVERLFRLMHDAENRQRLRHLRPAMDDIALLPTITLADAAPGLINRMNRRFEPLLNLARLFLDGGVLQLARGSTDSYAFLFDMNQLFEAFVVGFIQSHRDEILPASWSDCELLSQSRGEGRHLARSEGTPVFRLRPDLAFQLDHQFPLLVDAKYKGLDPGDSSLGVSQGDFYQMHAYVHRYRCPRVVLLYPQTAEMPDPLTARFRLETDHDTDIVAATIDVRGDLRTSQTHQQLVSRLCSLLQPS